MDDWRLTNQIEYLYEKKIVRTRFFKTEGNEHEHCEFCFEKFGEEDNMLHAGYCTCDRYYWICDQCYNDFRKTFNWIVDESESVER